MPDTLVLITRCQCGCAIEAERVTAREPGGDVVTAKEAARLMTRRCSCGGKRKETKA